MDAKVRFNTSIIAVATFIITAFPFSLVSADIVSPTVTNVYFDKGGKLYDKPVSFTINCYGYTLSPSRMADEKQSGTYTPAVVFSFFASCPAYGCKIYQPYYLNYRHIDYCDLVGKADGKQFEIKKYSTEPVNFSECKDIPRKYDVETCSGIGVCKYYKRTDAYEKCVNRSNPNENCDKYLAEVNYSQLHIEKDDKGEELERSCKLKFIIPKE